MSTALNAIRLAIETHIQTNYTNSPTTGVNPTQFENVRFDSPANAIWASLSLGFIPTQIAGFGAVKRWRHSGIISVTINAPKNTSTIAAYQEADTVATLLRHKTLSGVQTLTPSVTVGGYTGGNFQLIVVVPFYYDGISAT